jgi:hypothetical protein
MRKKKKILFGVVPLVAAVGLWFGLGIAGAKPHVAVHAHQAVAHTAVAHTAAHAKAPRAASKSSEDPTSTDTDNVQSGDQTSPDSATASVRSSSASEDPSGSEGESTTPETDNVDCQQDGNFDGVNAAGTGPGCDGSGT